MPPKKRKHIAEVVDVSESDNKSDSSSSDIIITKSRVTRAKTNKKVKAAKKVPLRRSKRRKMIKADTSDSDDGSEADSER